MKKNYIMNIFKSRWFKFIRRTLMDWMALVIIVSIIMYCSRPNQLDINYTPEIYDLELRVEELEDSINKMQLKLGVYDEAVKWFRNADDEELKKGIEQIRSVPKDVPLP